METIKPHPTVITTTIGTDTYFEAGEEYQVDLNVEDVRQVLEDHGIAITPPVPTKWGLYADIAQDVWLFNIDGWHLLTISNGGARADDKIHREFWNEDMSIFVPFKKLDNK